MVALLDPQWARRLFARRRRLRRSEPVIHCGPAANCTGPALSECEVALYNGASVELVATNPVCAGPAFVALEWSAPCAPSIADSCRFTLGSKDVTVTVLGLSGAR